MIHVDGCCAAETTCILYKRRLGCWFFWPLPSIFALKDCRHRTIYWPNVMLRWPYLGPIELHWWSELSNGLKKKKCTKWIYTQRKESPQLFTLCGNFGLYTRNAAELVKLLQSFIRDSIYLQVYFIVPSLVSFSKPRQFYWFCRITSYNYNEVYL